MIKRTEFLSSFVIVTRVKINNQRIDENVKYDREVI